MWFEWWALKEEENKKRKLTEKEKKQELKKQAEFKKTKEKISTQIDTECNLDKLKDLIDQWIITQEVAEKVVNNENIDEETIKEIFEKIDQMEDIKDISKYIPDELRITKEDYSKALTDDIFRVQMLTKLDSALIIIANQVVPDSSMWLNLFWWFLSVLDKNLILVQENTIDVKENLREVDEKKFWKKIDKRSFWRKIIDFLKEVTK